MENFNFKFNKNQQEILYSGVKEPAFPYFFLQIFKANSKQPYVIITYNEKRANEIYKNIKELINVFLKSRTHVLYFPANESLPYEISTHSPDITGQRIKTLKDLITLKNFILIMSAESAIRLIPDLPYEKFIINLSVHKEYSIDKLINYFHKFGYKREIKVEVKGQYALRGGILDIYPPYLSYPFRIEFFDEEIESIRIFNPVTQMSVENADNVEILPVSEMIWENNVIKNIQYLKNNSAIPASDIIKLENYLLFGGIERYFPFIFKKLKPVFEYVKSNANIFIEEPFLCVSAIDTFFDTQKSIFTHSDFKKIAKAPESYFLNSEKFINIIKSNFKTIFYSSTSKNKERFMKNCEIIRIKTSYVPEFKSRISKFTRFINENLKQGKTVLIPIGNKGLIRRVQEIMSEYEIPYKCIKSIDFQEGIVCIANASASRGALLHDFNLVILTLHEIFDYPDVKSYKRPHTKVIGNVIDFSSDFKPGDYVVHVEHGIGIYKGITLLKTFGKKEEYFEIQYLGNDKLYVPVIKAHLIQKYIGQPGIKPEIYSLSGKKWDKVKNRAKKAAQKLAKELLRLQAIRKLKKGFPFRHTSEWEKELADSFPYIETDGQLKAIEDVFKDMEKDRVMDRLICGDVGFGKTEVAIRASMRAVMNGKQVAILTPTTILAQQHFKTFSERLSPFPVKIAVLSRFKTKSQQKKIIADLKNGKIDIIIGTHRILSKDVMFYDLGLLIIDEEQRFGVKHKEKLKFYKETVDVLTLTATPIPRTLYMSLTNARDMSIISTPPPDRLSIKTHLGEYSDDIVKLAIVKELNRKGQVFYVHNNIETMKKVYEHLVKLIPFARIAMAHGRMDKSKLEKVYLKFINHEIDVLICTTIIESGLDIKNANTIIVDSAEKYGLSQLYQLRGRVGRSERQAFAYFFYDKSKIFTESAKKRLEAIEEFTNLGSGFKLSMRDLEIRGAGNLLGEEQSGFVTSVGFELYCQLLRDVIEELKTGIIKPEVPDPVLNLKVEAYIPETFIPDTLQKIEIYKKISCAKSIFKVDEIDKELRDRFGALPTPVINLIIVGKIRVYALTHNIIKINRYSEFVIIEFFKEANINPQTIKKLKQKFPNRVEFHTGKEKDTILKIKVSAQNETKFLEYIQRFLSFI